MGIKSLIQHLEHLNFNRNPPLRIGSIVHFLIKRVVNHVLGALSKRERRSIAFAIKDGAIRY